MSASVYSGSYRTNMMCAVWWWWCAVALAGLVAGGGGAEPAPVLFLGRRTYSVQTTLLLSELAGKHRDVGYRLEASLQVEPAWAEPDQQRFLLRFQLESPALLLRGAHRSAEYARVGSVWDAHAHSAFYARWEAGRVSALYLDPADPPDVLNYKRALVSLFQFQLVDGEYKETDISGECDVMYETISSSVFRKIKRGCAFESAADGEGLRARRVSRYTLSGARDAISALHADEVVWLAWGEGRAQGEEALGVRARSLHELVLRSDTEPAPREPDLDKALAALPPALVETPLPLHDDDDDEEDAQSLESAVSEHAAALSGAREAGAGGSLEEAQALSPLLSALRRASAADLAALLDRADLQDDLSGVWRALGLAGSRAGWQAARPRLAPGARDALEQPTLDYLAGLALSDAPHEEVVADVLKLGSEAKLASIAEQALLAGAAAAARCGPALQLAARDSLAAALARCAPGGVACRALRLRALGNLRRADTASLLLAAAESEAGGAEEALGALLRLPPRALPAVAAERAALLAGNASRALPTRALALELALEACCGRAAGGAVPLAAVRLARALAQERGAAAHELRRVLWQRLDALEESPAVRALRRVLPSDLTTWDSRAHAGTSSVLSRATGWQWGGAGGGGEAGWGARLDSVQLASRGLLRRGRVVLQAHAPHLDQHLDLLTVEVRTRGLEAVAGGGEGAAGQDGEGEEESPAAELQLAVAGAALRPVTLFDGQAELLGHIWSGTGSAPTPVSRALVPAQATAGAGALQAGAALRAEACGGGALALDAHAAVSLWQRSASAGLALRAGGAARVAARVRTRWSELRVRAEAAAAPRMRIRADLDFYSRVSLCVRTHIDPHERVHSVWLQSVGGARALRVTRTRRVTRRVAGRTLALGRENDAVCRTLRAADDD